MACLAALGPPYRHISIKLQDAHCFHIWCETLVALAVTLALDRISCITGEWISFNPKAAISNSGQRCVTER